jgi:hypothetical protein
VERASEREDATVQQLQLEAPQLAALAKQLREVPWSSRPPSGTRAGLTTVAWVLGKEERTLEAGTSCATHEGELGQTFEASTACQGKVKATELLRALFPAELSPMVLERTTRESPSLERAQGEPVIEGSCDASGACRAKGLATYQCFVAVAPHTFDCLAQPWARGATRVRDVGHGMLPTESLRAWSFEVQGLGRCTRTDGRTERFACNDGTLLVDPMAGGHHWVLFKAAPTRLAMPGRPLVPLRYYPLPGQRLRSTGPALPTGEDYEVSLEGSVGAASEHFTVRGHAGAARATHAVGDGKSATLRQGVLKKATVQRLWAALDFHHWPTLSNQADPAQPLSGLVDLFVRRGETTALVRVVDDLEREPFPPPSWAREAETAAAVRAAFRELKPLTWTTRFPKLPKPPAGARAEPALCFPDGACASREGASVQCVPAPNPQQRFCPQAPWDSRGFLVEPVPPKPTAFAPRLTIWGVELMDRRRCSAAYGERALRCPDGAWVERVWGGPQGPLLAEVLREDGRSDEVPVLQAWRLLPAQPPEPKAR